MLITWACLLQWVKVNPELAIYTKALAFEASLKLKGAQSRLKSLAQLFKFVVCNPRQSSPSLTILVPLWFIIVSLMFFYLYKVLFLGFLQFNGYFFRCSK